MQYAQDYDERLPFRNFAGANDDWVNPIMPYVKSVQIFACPSDATKPATGKGVLSYAGNYNAMQEPSAGAGGPKLSAYTSTANTIWVTEATKTNSFDFTDSANNDWSGWQSSGSISFGQWWWGTQLATGYIPGSGGEIFGIDNCNMRVTDCHRQHFEGANYLAADGHVKWLKASSVTANSEAPDFAGAGKHALTFNIS